MAFSIVAVDTDSWEHKVTYAILNCSLTFFSVSSEMMVVVVVVVVVVLVIIF